MVAGGVSFTRLTQPAPAPADLVVVHARVYTVDAARPEAQAVAIRGDRIVVGRHRCGGARAPWPGDTGDRRGRARRDSRTARRARSRARTRPEPAGSGTARHDERAGRHRRRAGAGAAGAEGASGCSARDGTRTTGPGETFPGRSPSSSTRPSSPALARGPESRGRPRDVGDDGEALLAAGEDYEGHLAGPGGGRIPPGRERAKPTGILVDNAMNLVFEVMTSPIGRRSTRRSSAAVRWRSCRAGGAHGRARRGDGPAHFFRVLKPAGDEQGKLPAARVRDAADRGGRARRGTEYRRLGDARAGC